MGTNRNTKSAGDVLVPVNFRVPRDLIDSFRALVEREERNVSQDLRHYMAKRVAAAADRAAERAAAQAERAA